MMNESTSQTQQNRERESQEHEEEPKKRAPKESQKRVSVCETRAYIE